MIGTGLPIVLGLFYPDWPDDAEQSALTRNLSRRIRSGAKAFFKKECLRWQQKMASALIVATPAAITVLHQPDRIKEKIFLVHIGIDIEHFSPGASGIAGNNDQHILFLASLWRRKGILTLLEAFDIVAARLPRSRLTVVGSGGIEAEVHARADKMTCRERINFISGVSRAEMPQLARQCSVYCLPSYGEPQGNSALELMACGKPIVGTNAGGLGHLIEPEGGRKVPPRDAQALAEALIEILISPELQARMGRFNRRLLEEQYTWEHTIEHLEAIYKTVIGKQATTPGPALTSSSLTTTYLF